MDYSDKDAAVLVIRELSSNTLLLTKRTDFLSDHPGEICFPGGRWDINDKDLKMTAFREFYEELGFDLTGHVHLEAIAPVITLKAIKIHPWYGEIAILPSLVINSEEVDSVIKLPFDSVKDRHRYQTFEIAHGTGVFQTLKFDYAEAFIWGATAKIMQQLAQSTS